MNKNENDKVKWYEKAIVLTIITAVLGGVGYIAKTFYFERSQKKWELSYNEQNKLYEKSEVELKKVYSSLDDIINIMTNEQALTTEELNTELNKIQEAIQSYNDFVMNLERTGNINQINEAKNISSILSYMINDIELQILITKNLSLKISNFLYSNGIDEYEHKIILSDLTQLIQAENRLFYSLKNDYEKIKFKQKKLNLTFRDVLDIKDTKDVQQNLVKMPNLLEYHENKYPFIIAKQRKFFAPNIKLDAEFLEQKNNELALYEEIDFIKKNRKEAF